MDITDILGVVVLYKTKINLSEALISINNSLFSVGKLDIVVYDHSTVADDNRYYYENLNIIYKHDPRNISLGVAYNYTAELAKTMKKCWILLLDQDTVFKYDLFQKYLSSIKDYPNESMFVPILKLQDNSIFSPSRYFFKRGFHLKKIQTGINSLKYKSPVNSGMLIKLEVYILSKGYNEDVFLDFSDFQFIERFKLIHNTFVVINSSGMQDFSNDTKDISKIINRFSVYCQSARNCEKNTLIDKIQYFAIVFSRAISLTIKNDNLIFFKVFLINYIR